MKYLNIIFILFVFTAICFAQSNDSAAQSNSFEDLLRANSVPIELQNGELLGQGVSLLESEMNNVQFVAFGEEHNNRAVHQFGGALFRLLHKKYGFQYLALEEDSYWGMLLSKAARQGGSEAVLNLGLRYPNAFHLYTEDEIKMIGEIGKASSAPENPIWGLNQVFGATHIYERLVQLAPNAQARRVAEKLHGESLEYEKERFQRNVSYLSKIAKPEDFARLREAFKPKPQSEADWLIEQISLSNKIFSPFVAKPSPPSSVFYESGKARETNMKHLFAERYRQAQAKRNKLPKVLAMFGHLHLYRGLSENTQLFTLGNYLSELAIFNNMQSFHIYSAANYPGIEKSFIAPLARIGGEVAGNSAFGALINLRPLIDSARYAKDMDPKLRRLILSYDVFLFLRDGERGSTKRLETPRFRWYPDGN